MKSFRLRNGELVLPSQRITPGTSTLVIRLVDYELSDDGDGGDGGGVVMLVIVVVVMEESVSQSVMLRVFLVVIVK